MLAPSHAPVPGRMPIAGARAAAPTAGAVAFAAPPRATTARAAKHTRVCCAAWRARGPARVVRRTLGIPWLPGGRAAAAGSGSADHLRVCRSPRLSRSRMAGSGTLELWSWLVMRC